MQLCLRVTFSNSVQIISSHVQNGNESEGFINPVRMCRSLEGARPDSSKVLNRPTDDASGRCMC